MGPQLRGKQRSSKIVDTYRCAGRQIYRYGATGKLWISCLPDSYWFTQFNYHTGNFMFSGSTHKLLIQPGRSVNMNKTESDHLLILQYKDTIYVIFYLINFIDFCKYAYFETSWNKGNHRLRNMWNAPKTPVWNISQINRLTGNRWEYHDRYDSSILEKGSVVQGRGSPLFFVFKWLYSYNSLPFLVSGVYLALQCLQECSNVRILC